MARTTPVSRGWTILVRPLGMIFPEAVATMSIFPNEAQASAIQNSAMMLQLIISAYGVTGVSTTSRAAGRNACSSRLRLGAALRAAVAVSPDFMDPALQPIKRGIAAASLDQLIMDPILH